MLLLPPHALRWDVRRYALCFFHGHGKRARDTELERYPMPAIASPEDLKAAFKKWRKIGWKNICKLWLQERTPEELKGEGDH